MARSEAQKRADKAYRANSKTQKFQVALNIDEITSINKFCENICKPAGVSKARFIFWACNYFIERGELPPESEVKRVEDDSDSGEF